MPRMKILILKRIAQTEAGTFGVLIHDLHPFCVTLERPWKDNQQNISCIPEGNFIFKRRFSEKRDYEVYEACSVPNRKYIQIHKGNRLSDTNGCILVGEKFEKLGNIYGVFESGKAFNELMGIIGDDWHFMLKIVPAKREEFIAI